MRLNQGIGNERRKKKGQEVQKTITSESAKLTMGFIIQVTTLVLRRLSVRTQVGIETSCFQVWLCLLPDDHHPPFSPERRHGQRTNYRQ
jgi:hypothetical protein